MMDHLILVTLGFLLYALVFITLRYGFHHHNKLVKIYCIFVIVWQILVWKASIEAALMTAFFRFNPINLLLGMLPLIPLWIFYKFAPGEREARAKEEQEYRDRMGIGKTPEEHMKFLKDTGKISEETYTKWAIKEGIIKPPSPKPPTEAQMRQWALEEEKRKKEAEKEAEKLAKGWTDGELIDKYIELDVAVEAVGFGPEGVGVEGWNAINDELKYRNISSRRIEKRRKELEQKWLKERHQGLPEERLIDDYIWWLIKSDVGDAKLEGAEFDSMCDEIKRRGIIDKQIKKRRKKLRKYEEAYKKEKERIVMMKEIKEIKCGNCGTKITKEQMNFVEMHVKAKRKDFPVTTTTLECRKCKNKIRYVHYPDPKDMTDKELIKVYINMEAGMDSDAVVLGLDNFTSYYKGCIIAELERRGIDESRYSLY